MRRVARACLLLVFASAVARAQDSNTTSTNTTSTNTTSTNTTSTNSTNTTDVPPPPPPPPPPAPPAEKHKYLDIPVHLINTDVSANFFSSDSTSATGAGVSLNCYRGCVASDEVKLDFCAERVTYTFCKRGDPTTLGENATNQLAVDLMEQTTRKAFLSLTRELMNRGFDPSATCRARLRRWFCYEFFNQCTADETLYMPTCLAECHALKKACGDANSAFIDCDLEWEEQDFGGSTPATYFEGGTYSDNGTYVNSDDTKGLYIRGVKPNGEYGTPIFEPKAGRCTGAAHAARVTFALASTVFALVALSAR